MKTRRFLPALMAAVWALAGVAQAQTERPVRPADSYGQPRDAKPAEAPQRPEGSFGQRGQRPSDAGAQRGSRPAESYGQRGGRPDGVSGRPRGR